MTWQNIFLSANGIYAVKIIIPICVIFLRFGKCYVLRPYNTITFFTGVPPGTVVTYALMILPHRPDANNLIILGISLPISIATYRDTRKSPLGICKCRRMGLVLAFGASTSSGSGRSIALCR